MTIIIVLFNFWFWRHFDVLVDVDVLEKHTVAIFQG
jgi:hypothetical protein